MGGLTGVAGAGCPGQPGFLLGTLPYTSEKGQDVGISGNGGGEGGAGITGGYNFTVGEYGATANGHAGVGPGGGGGGGFTLSAGGTNAFATGGAGAGGYVRITEYHM